MSTWPLSLGVAPLAIVATLGCADLPTGDGNRCGNRIFEPEAGEDCDSDASAFGDQAACSETCRLICTDGAVCPDGYACGGDGICRAESGDWALAETFDEQDLPRERVRLTALQFRPDAPDELLHTFVETEPGAVPQVSCALHTVGSEDGPSTESLPCLTPELVADLDGDGLDDVLSTTEGALATPTRGEFEVVLGDDTAYRFGAQATRVLPDVPVRMFRLTTNVSFDVAQLGRDVAILDSDLRVAVGFPELLPVDYDFESVGLVSLQPFGGSSSPQPAELLTTLATSPGRVEILRSSSIELSLGRTVLMPDGVTPVGRASSFDVDGDLVMDLVVAASSGQLFVAYGNLDGSFQSAPGGGVADFRLSTYGGPLLQPGGPLLLTDDINGDGCLDAVFRNTTQLSFAGCGGSNLGSGLDITQVALGDVDVNGIPDLITINNAAGVVEAGLGLLRFSLDGSSTRQQIAATSVGQVVAVDTDGDLTRDVVFSATEDGATELRVARGQVGAALAEPTAFARFPVVEQLVAFPASPDERFLAAVQTQSGLRAAVSFAPGDPPRPINAWQARAPLMPEDAVDFNPRALAVGEFDGDPAGKELAGLVGFASKTPALAFDRVLGESRLAHFKIGDDQLIGVFDGAWSDPIAGLKFRDYYAVVTRLGVAPNRDGLLVAVPTQFDTPEAGSDIYLATLDADRRWSWEPVMHSDALIANRPPVFDGGARGQLAEELLTEDPLGEGRIGARTLVFDLDGDGRDEAVVVPNRGASLWLVFAGDGQGRGGLALQVGVPASPVQDVVAVPNEPGVVVWTGLGGTYRGRIDTLADRRPGPGGVDIIELGEVERLFEDGGDAVAVGQFDDDGLLDVAIADSSSVRVYSAIPTRQ